MGESPANAVDGTDQKYLNFGDLNSGLIVTPASGASVINSFQISTPNDFENRDPSAWQLFGTSDPISSADNSTGLAENWTLIDSGTLALPTARRTLGPLVTVANNTTSYTSYKMMFSDLKGGAAAGEMQIGELKFFGNAVPEGEALLAPGDPILAIDAGGNSSYPAEESPDNAIDGTLDKYLNFGEINSGFIVTPFSGSSFVESFQIITANDFQERDPLSWELFGTNDSIVSSDNSTGTSENWTLIDAGSTALPSARNTYAPVQSIDSPHYCLHVLQTCFHRPQRH